MHSAHIEPRMELEAKESMRDRYATKSLKLTSATLKFLEDETVRGGRSARTTGRKGDFLEKVSC